jgi:FkbM family methyltransferase
VNLASFIAEKLNRLLRSRWALRAEFEALLRTAYRAGEIRVVYDIGAHKGRWARYIKSLLPDVEPYLFEANPLHARELAATGFKYFLSALSRPGVTSAAFYSLEDDSGSTGASFYRERTPQYAAVAEQVLAAKTLREVVAEERLPLPDFVKLDTQGSELDVIAGGEDIVRHASHLLVEIPFVEYNRGAPGAGDYLAALATLGFYPLALVEQHHYQGVLIQADVLFIARSRVTAGATAL